MDFFHLIRRYGVIVAIASLAVIYFLIRDEANVMIVEDPFSHSPAHTDEQNETNVGVQEVIVVDIKGSVKKPGVYELAHDKRVHDAIQVAGGFTETADQTQINLAQRLQDEMVIYVPKKGEDRRLMNEAVSNHISEGTKKIRINTATLEEITTLNGIGPKKAQAIIDYRDEHGLFKTIEDLLEIPGIGEKTVENIKEFIQLP